MNLVFTFYNLEHFNSLFINNKNSIFRNKKSGVGYYVSFRIPHDKNSFYVLLNFLSNFINVTNNNTLYLRLTDWGMDFSDSFFINMLWKNYSTFKFSNDNSCFRVENFNVSLFRELLIIFLVYDCTFDLFGNDDNFKIRFEEGLLIEITVNSLELKNYLTEGLHFFNIEYRDIKPI